MKIMKTTKLIATTCLAVASLAQAAPANALDCADRIKAVRVQQNGTVEVRLASGTTHSNVCNVKSASYYGMVTAEACREWVSLLTAGLLSGREIKLYEVKKADGNNAGTCNDDYLIPATVGLLE